MPWWRLTAVEPFGDHLDRDDRAGFLLAFCFFQFLDRAGLVGDDQPREVFLGDLVQHVGGQPGRRLILRDVQKLQGLFLAGWRGLLSA